MAAGELPARLARLPEYQLAMVRRLPPRGTPVVPGSTPVVAFGDPARAEVATLGINPSANEFLEHSRLLSGSQRRLATLESLGAQRLDRLTEAQVTMIVADCATYFQQRPYRRWFDPLDELLRAGADASYYDGSACHLDLVQWATQPVWGKIAHPGVRQTLLDDGVPHLRVQLARENVRLVLLNGREVLDQVAVVRLADLEEVGHLPLAGQVLVHQVRSLASLGTPQRGQPKGRRSWPGSGARPWWSARPVTTSSTTGILPPPRHRSLESHVHRKVPAWFGGGPYGEGPASTQAPRRAAYPVESRLVLPRRW